MSEEALSTYPLVPDWEAKTRDLTPSEARREPTWSLLVSVTEPLGVLDQQQADIVRNLDPLIATGRFLEICGERVGERRAGLADDDEYRRIVRGREAASTAQGTWSGVSRTWMRLSGAAADRVRMYRVPSTGNPCVYLEAEINFIPTALFLRRAAEVLRETVIATYDVSAVLYPADALRDGHLPPWSTAVWSWAVL